jgi:hypothetical protein
VWLWLGANLILALSWPQLRTVAALALLALLPGWVWLPIFLPFPRPELIGHNDLSTALPGQRKASPLLNLGERLILAIGLSLALTIIGAMVTVYLPGPFDLTRLWIVVNLIIVVGLVYTTFKRSNVERSNVPTFNALLIAGLLAILLLAAALRLFRLGYAEFHEDEAEALMLGVRLMQGEDYALFLHRKGPAQMLLPVTFWLFNGHITEGLARFPFVLSSLLSVVTLFFIGRRWFGWPAGVIAALLWAINGYAIAFGRMVQYQALIFFLGPLGLYCLYLAGTETLERSNAGRWQILGAILLAVCLLAHFDALMLLPAAAYLFWVANRRISEWPKEPFRHSPFAYSPAVIALSLFFGLLAAFYVPYLLDPEFKNTAGYLVESRVKPGWIYNNFDLLRRLDQVYSSRFYWPVLAFGIAACIVEPIVRRRQWWGAFATVEARAVWLMFGAGFIGYVFLVDDPRTHLYIIYPGAVLLAGKGIYDLRILNYEFRNFISSPFHLFASSLLRLFVFLVAVLLVSLIVIYEAVIFLSTESALSWLRQRWDGSTWERIYADMPQERDYFAYPKREGWKAVGALRARGMFPGDFRSVNEDFIIPIWYNFGQARSCYDTPAHYFVRAPGIDFYIPAQQIQAYDEVAWVQREGETRLRLFSTKAEAASPLVTPSIYPLEAFEDTFDQLATPIQFIEQAQPSQPVGAVFGQAIELVGFDLPQTTVSHGETLYLNLYWRALSEPGDRYRAFVHLTDGANLWAQQDDDPACRLPTSVWRVGQHGLGQFRLVVKPDTLPGRYPLIVGLYQADTLERLKITGGAGQVGDDFLWLGDVEVTVK